MKQAQHQIHKGLSQYTVLLKQFVDWTQGVADTADWSDFVHHLQKNVNPSALFNTKNLLFPQPLEKIAPLPPERAVPQN